MTKSSNSPTLAAPEHPHGCLRGASLFSNLSEDEIARFQDAAHERSYKKGKILYLQDEAAEFFYVICGGWIKLFHTMPEGEEVIIDMLTSGHMVGESAIFELGRHTSSAQVVEDVQLLSIPASLLKEQISLSPTLALSMLSSMSRHHPAALRRDRVECDAERPPTYRLLSVKAMPGRQEKGHRHSSALR